MKNKITILTSVIGAMLCVASIGENKQVFHADAKAAGGGDGSKARPFASPLEVRDGLRKLRKEGKLATDRPIEVLFASGDYPVLKSIDLDKSDAGTAEAPIVWKSEKPRGARFIGGVKIKADMFAPLKDESVLKRIPEEARGKILAADLSSVCKEPFPQMQGAFTAAPTRPALFVNHNPGTIARWPNEGWTGFEKAFKTGINHAKPGMEEKNTRYPGSFVYDNPRALRWNFAEGVWLNGYLTHDWYNESVQLAGLLKDQVVDKGQTNNVIQLKYETSFGVKGGATWGRKDRRFYVFNLIDELDAPGEYYIDRTKKLLYFHPPKDCELAQAEIVVANNSGIIIKSKGLSNFALDGIAIEYSAFTAVSISSARNVSIRNCYIANINEHGIDLNGYSNSVVNCEISGIGRTGVSIGGGDRAKLISSESIAEGNVVHDFGRYQRTYAGAFNLYGCGLTLRKNKMYDAPHGAVFWGGNEMLIECNEVFNVLLETSDAGAYYTGRDWTTCGNVLRYNFTHHLGGGKDGHAATMGFYFDDCDCGDEVYGNIFWKVPRGIMIGGGREHPVRNNIFAECEIGLSMDCRGMSWKHWNVPGGSWHLEGKAEKLKYKEDPWKSRYPWLANIMNENPQQPLNNPLENNIFIDCKKEIFSVDENRMTNFIHKCSIKDNLVINTAVTNGQKTAKIAKIVSKGFRVENGTPEKPFDPGFVDWQNGDFRIRKGGWIEKNFPNFKDCSKK